MIIKSDLKKDFETIYEIINDASIAYKGIIPSDRWQEPYMSKEELKKQIIEGVEFWNFVEDNRVLGVMGIQFKKDVTLIRHAYVRTLARQKGIGGKLLNQLINMSDAPILIGTWADASWAINFYEKNGFKVLPETEKNKLLKIYWNIPERQVETSIVLASNDWKNYN
ncbi:GNAT family N-acetyltransferase [Tenacibaculum retecalamus]|uniref:GNAT family N-acetyltransferase n=1 Tax=Tenacibaculum retecalamus TaxID=3018315 RepID=UPI0023D96DE7|nr:GNAT family N-acetyltransferase [Tenacibaculum retecalamus]WBX71069.1 GNAT family N-acetyltransferase [Tenacibaculum retecalamus]